MCESDSCILQFLNELNLTYRRLTGFVASFYSIQKCWCLGAGFHCVTLLSDLFRLSGIRSQSWLWVAWPRDHYVRIACSGSGPINALEAECSGKLKASMARAGCDEGSVDSRRCLHHWWDSYKSFRGEAGQRGNVPEWENRVCSYYVKKKITTSIWSCLQNYFDFAMFQHVLVLSAIWLIMPQDFLCQMNSSFNKIMCFFYVYDVPSFLLFYANNIHIRAHHLLTKPLHQEFFGVFPFSPKNNCVWFHVFTRILEKSRFSTKIKNKLVLFSSNKRVLEIRVIF